MIEQVRATKLVGDDDGDALAEVDVLGWATGADDWVIGPPLTLKPRMSRIRATRPEPMPIDTSFM